MSKKKKHEEFVEDLKNINSNIEVIGKYKTAKDYIDVKCKKCGGEWNPKANNLLNGNGCPYCCPTPRKILIGFNDIWTTNPDVAKLLANPEDGYKYTQYSGVKVDWKCPDCGYIVKNKKIGHVSYYHFSCPRCGDGISYPEKFIISLLNQINIEYEKEKEFEWCKNRRYDFYLSYYNIIIEAHGLQHYKSEFEYINNKKIRTLLEEQNNDKYKQQSAQENGINNYIIIDCRKSELEWIKNNILNSKLVELFDLSNIDWLKCHEFACNSFVKIACEYWNNGINNTKEIGLLMKLHYGTVRDYLKKGCKLNWCNYNAKEEMIKKGIKTGKKNSKKVKCVETGIIFNSIAEAVKEIINAKVSQISQCCKKQRNVSGKLEDGTLLHWEYVNNNIIV